MIRQGQTNGEGGVIKKASNVARGRKGVGPSQAEQGAWFFTRGPDDGGCTHLWNISEVTSLCHRRLSSS